MNTRNETPGASAGELTEDFRVRFFNGQVERLVRNLRGLADDIERTAKPRATPSITGTPRFTCAAEGVVHDLIWGFANLHADGLIEAAVQADAAERGE